MFITPGMHGRGKEGSSPLPDKECRRGTHGTNRAEVDRKTSSYLDGTGGGNLEHGWREKSERE